MVLRRLIATDFFNISTTSGFGFVRISRLISLVHGAPTLVLSHFLRKRLYFRKTVLALSNSNLNTALATNRINIMYSIMSFSHRFRWILLHSTASSVKYISAPVTGSILLFLSLITLFIACFAFFSSSILRYRFSSNNSV
jgi:hypothetical protein